MTNPEESLFPDWPQNTTVPGVVIGKVSYSPDYKGTKPTIEWSDAAQMNVVIDGPREATGEELRDQGMSAAEEAAYAEWKDTILYWIEECAFAGAEFSAEDIRLQAGDPPDGRGGNAIGSLFHSASRRGLIERVGWRTADRASAHARQIAVWRGTDG